jgi:hypothetical protein
MLLLLMIYLIHLNNNFQRPIAAPSATPDNSLTEFAMSNLECLTRYSSMPTQDLNLVCSSAVINVSFLSGRFTIDLGGAEV